LAHPSFLGVEKAVNGAGHIAVKGSQCKEGHINQMMFAISFHMLCDAPLQRMPPQKWGCSTMLRICLIYMAKIPRMHVTYCVPKYP